MACRSIRWLWASDAGPAPPQPRDPASTLRPPPERPPWAPSEAFGVAVVHDPRLREKSYGEAGGRPQEWLDRRFVPPPAAGERLEHDEGIEGAQTKAQWVRRVYEATEDILRRPARQQIVVTHGGTLTFVLAAWIGMPYEATGYVSFRAPAGSITTLREDDWFHNRQIAALGDTRRLLNPAASP
ncbi:histidine phosphatase family protein [Streptomyces sp. TRM66268-LWL]|uniref:Histidine phosphatase family protein n=1 Tax=Streptomyces polyasparticus TaxID=2767826 RepID=A0ABR7SLE2_9ACTN|nr:histidine phosphatase family protein [Streptomyces polyasparticus]MBC9715153.1 histidine phosphatase family protein [Streptomyces polyasparticus]